MHELETDDDSIFILRLWGSGTEKCRPDRHRTYGGRVRETGRSSIFGPLSFCCPRNSPPENDNAPKNEKCSMLQNAHFDAVVFINTPKSQR
eukprot:scaffold2398_cov94-Skeletonema_dohrnii-CCMP3373.AAC.3